MDLKGHHLKIASVSYFPYADFKKENDTRDGTVTLIDSLDYRILEAIRRPHNFT